ncbi:MAG: AAA family ATPase [Pseudomonadota bacterium]
MGKRSNLRIVGLTGRNASGKGEAAAILKRLGYLYRSLSDMVREEASRRGLDLARENLITVANDLRRKEGPGVFAARTVPLLGRGCHVIDSIRHPEEVRILRKAGSFFLIAVDAPVELRFERARKRGRNESAGSLTEFIRMENLERTNETNAQQLDATFVFADCVIANTGTVQELETAILTALRDRRFPLHSKNDLTEVGSAPTTET